ncbi:Blue-light photoreceptor PHR2 [Vitis vinifera]|uniref:Blue-light photoreceptor PHR2 n=1 Tax=Vitis vinifera TaxID=29760 RepID=A0A438KIB7_VITVI|nr:Blue-light photoreceptor PHR2 [Vitis vinifera]
MDPNLQTLENPETQSSDEQTQLAIIAPPLLLFLFLCLRFYLPTFSSRPRFLPTCPPSKQGQNSIPGGFSCSPLSFFVSKPAQVVFQVYPHLFFPSPESSVSGASRSSDPSNAAGIRRSCVVWFRNDLRVHDNECLNSASNESMSMLPVYCFDPRDYGKSSSGFDKTGPYRASFLIESVSDLRQNLQKRGSDLVVRIGKPETVLVELAKAVGADAIYAHREVSHDEVKGEEKIEAAMKEEGVEVKYFWGSTLYHVDDLPFKMEQMPHELRRVQGESEGFGNQEDYRHIGPVEGASGERGC